MHDEIKEVLLNCKVGARLNKSTKRVYDVLIDESKEALHVKIKEF